MRFLARMGFFLLIVSPIAFLLVADPIRRAPEPRPTPSARTVEFRVCPGISVRPAPRGLAVIKRDLRNLGENVMGRSIQYTGQTQRVWVAVGYDVLDALEDLDFTEESALRVGDRQVSVTTTDVIAAHRIRAGTWRDERFEPPCDEFSVVTWNLPQKKFIDIVDSVKIVYGESRQGGIG